MTIKHEGWMERRQFERVDATVKVTYRVFPKSDLKDFLAHHSYKDTTAAHIPALSKKSTVLNAVTKDISIGGMSLVGAEKFSSDMVLEIQLYLASYPTPLNFLAEVVSSRAEIPGLSRTNYRAGLRILAINNEDITRLDKFLLSEKLRKQNGGK